MSEQHILQIVPQLPGTLDGVGDYALNLARALSADHGLRTTFLVAARTSVTAKDGFPMVSGLDAAASSELAQRHNHVILHYVNYGYQARGVPLLLRTFVKRLRPQLRGSWVTTFHELYASGLPWQSAFWLRPFQVRIAYDMIDAATTCIVSNAPIQQAICAYDRSKPVRLVPVMSNFGEPQLSEFGTASPRRWVICGGTALIARSLHRFEQLRPLIPPVLAPEHLDVVGGRDEVSLTAALDRLKREICVHHYPEVGVGLAAEVLRQASFGFIDYFGVGKAWPGMVLKSTAFAALCAHGVVPVLSHREETIALDGDPLPGPYFLTAGAVRLPAPDELPQPLPARRADLRGGIVLMHFAELTLATTIHNNARMSAEMLQSFETNLGTVDKIVIVDDCSSRPCPLPPVSSGVRLIRLETAHGFCHASDVALRAVQTKYALLVDADVLFEPGDFVGGLAEFQKGNWAWVNFRQTNFQGQPQTAYEQPMIPPWIFAAGNQVLKIWEKFQRAPMPAPNARIVEVEAAHSSCTLVNMEAFHAAGGFDRAYWQCQSDIDLSLRLREAGQRVGIDFGYCVKHEGAGGKTGGPARVLDLYRSRLRLYEHFHPASRLYLRPLLFVRHALEMAWFALVALFKNEPRLQTRVEMLKGVLKGYR
jgi:GT2 family glycosyltransferase